MLGSLLLANLNLRPDSDRRLHIITQGRWKLEDSLNDKMWIDIERKGKLSKWVTLRALRVIRALEGAK